MSEITSESQSNKKGILSTFRKGFEKYISPPTDLKDYRPDPGEASPSTARIQAFTDNVSMIRRYLAAKLIKIRNNIGSDAKALSVLNAEIMGLYNDIYKDSKESEESMKIQNEIDKINIEISKLQNEIDKLPAGKDNESKTSEIQTKIKEKEKERNSKMMEFKQLQDTMEAVLTQNSVIAEATDEQIDGKENVVKEIKVIKESDNGFFSKLLKSPIKSIEKQIADIDEKLQTATDKDKTKLEEDKAKLEEEKTKLEKKKKGGKKTMKKRSKKARKYTYKFF
jgi:chromosome segregation ATPase